MAPNPTIKYSLPAEIVLREIEGQTVLFSKKSGEFFGLNESAALFITDLLQDGLEIALTKAAALYDSTAEDLRGDFRELIDDLIEQGLLLQN